MKNEKRIGFVQTSGLGDIIIALPIADYYIENGWDVFWPIDPDFFEMFRRIKPSINFLSVPAELNKHGIDYFLNEPARMLRENDCEKIVVFYNYLSGLNVVNMRLAHSLKFDEYKYAIAGVPFERKWQLNYERDLESEESLLESLKISGDYVLIHDQSSAMATPLEIAPEWTRGLEVVRISAMTDSIFDWRLTMERATKLIIVDSCFATLTDQLNLENEKALFVHSPVAFTPVYMNDWRFIFPPRKLNAEPQ